MRKKERLDRRGFLGLAAAGAASLEGLAKSSSSAPEVRPTADEGLDFYDVSDWGVEGKGWTDTERYFDRLPSRAKAVVREPVWRLSRHSAGMLTRCETDATEIWVDYELLNERLEKPNTPATCVSGVDLYAQDPQGEWRWLSVTRPQEKRIKQPIVKDLAPGRRRYMVYLPPLNGVEYLKIGVKGGALFRPIPPRSEKPILIYGTSIVHGVGASRPGMPHPAILGRHLDRPVINLGFGGNRRMEKEVGALLTELDPCLYVIDCLPHMLGPTVAERAEPLVRQLRAARPKTPILLVEDRTYANTPFLPAFQERHRGSRAELRKAYQSLLPSGIADLHYLEGEKLLGQDRDDTVDGSHPSDLGFMRMAEVFEPVIGRILEG